MSLTILTLKLISILNTTLRTKAYGNYTKRTLIILKHRHSRTPTGLQLRDLNNYSNIIEYRSLTRRASQYHKHYIISLTRTTLQNGQMQKLSYSLIIKDLLIHV